MFVKCQGGKVHPDVIDTPIAHLKILGEIKHHGDTPLKYLWQNYYKKFDKMKFMQEHDNKKVSKNRRKDHLHVGVVAWTRASL